MRMRGDADAFKRADDTIMERHGRFRDRMAVTLVPMLSYWPLRPGEARLSGSSAFS